MRTRTCRRRTGCAHDDGSQRALRWVWTRGRMAGVEHVRGSKKSVVVAGWRQAKLRSHLESVVRCRGLCGPLGRHSSSSSSSRATPTTRAEPVYCVSSLRPLPMACADITQGMPFILPLVIATDGQRAAGIHKSPGLVSGRPGQQLGWSIRKPPEAR